MASLTTLIDRTMGGFERGPGAGGDLIGDIVHSRAGEGALEALGAIAVAERRNPGRKLLVWVGPGLGTGSDVNPEDPVKTEDERQVVLDAAAAGADRSVQLPGDCLLRRSGGSFVGCAAAVDVA
jgi:hypothetical protein